MTDRTEQVEIEELAELLVKFYINGTLKDTVYANEYRRRAKAILDAGYTRSNSPDTVKLERNDLALTIINQLCSHMELSELAVRQIEDACQCFGTVKVSDVNKGLEDFLEAYQDQISFTKDEVRKIVSWYGGTVKVPTVDDIKKCWIITKHKYEQDSEEFWNEDGEFHTICIAIHQLLTEREGK